MLSLYRLVLGPTGSLMGIISTLLVYVWLEWKRFKYPVHETFKLLGLVLVALIIGLLPNVDNFAHIGGLVTGILLSIHLMKNSDHLRVTNKK